MRVSPTEIADLLIVHIEAHRDARGFFAETWREEWGEKLGLARPFVQDNHARSEHKGVLRGLHFQKPPAAQSKLVWVTRGAAYDVAVDLRKGSPTYGRWHGQLLSEENMLRFFIPRGFAHGYMTLEPGTEFQYKVDARYSPEHECGIRWDDPDLAVSWPALEPVLSAKDGGLPLLRHVDSPFVYRKEQ
ncbi:dTDP-4-dehydrorhamnose 3,5-epimerase [Desulfovibrio sp. OttesenSCG-928-A18]|nr:dTDP-4-dehydrorhamnose 3,5-epimerase [Desulfovibrio sp. OttesenSCG-928-A18]